MTKRRGERTGGWNAWKTKLAQTLARYEDNPPLTAVTGVGSEPSAGRAQLTTPAIRSIRLHNATTSNPSAVEDALAVIAHAAEGEVHNLCRDWGSYAWAILDDLGHQGWSLKVVENDPQTPNGALGWHDVDTRGPYAIVDWGVIQHYGGTLLRGSLSLSAVITHELWETIGDPACASWEMDAQGVCWARELCDATENDIIELPSCDIANYLLPAYFNAFAKGPYDRLGVVQKPFEIRKGGYALKFDGNVSEVYDERAYRPRMGRGAFRGAR
jgi:hypothetical protein